MRHLDLFLAVSPLVGVLAACQSPTDPNRASAPTVVVAVAPSVAAIEPGESFRFTAAVGGADGTRWTPADLTWQSTDPSIASVGSDGMVQALTAGHVVIVADWQGTTGIARVTVLASTAKQHCLEALVAATAAVPQQQPSCE
jgi:uncharacterized protein YjdB